MRVILRHLLHEDPVAEAEGKGVAGFRRENVLPGCPPYRGRASYDQID